jgi:hypothetical protein
MFSVQVEPALHYRTPKEISAFLQSEVLYFPFPRNLNGVLAQLVERLNGIEEVRGSNPLGSRFRPSLRLGRRYDLLDSQRVSSRNWLKYLRYPELFLKADRDKKVFAGGDFAASTPQRADHPPQEHQS